MKKIILIALGILSIAMVACSKEKDESQTSDTYAAAMAGTYNMYAETILFEGSDTLETENVSGRLTITNTSGNLVTVSLTNDDQQYNITGSVDSQGIFHLDTFRLIDILISEKSSSIQMVSKNQLSGKARCILTRGEQVREAELTIIAQRS